MIDVAVRIQIWAPGLEAFPLLQGLGYAQLRPLPLSDPAGLQPDLPLLLLYSDPLAWMQAAAPAGAAAGATTLLDALPELLTADLPCRLVNLSCAQLPALVAWCVDPASQPPHESQPRFPAPDPFDALLASEWLQAHPEQLQAYQALEAHPLAAALDQRPPDLECLQLYRRAANLDALLQVRQDRGALEADLRELAAQLEPLRDQQLQALALREQLALLQARLHQADALQARCADLQLSLQAQQLDLEQLARRLALLERLVAAGSKASLRLQTRLAQTLIA